MVSDMAEASKLLKTRKIVFNVEYNGWKKSNLQFLEEMKRKVPKGMMVEIREMIEKLAPEHDKWEVVEHEMMSSLMAILIFLRYAEETEDEEDDDEDDEDDDDDDDEEVDVSHICSAMAGFEPQCAIWSMLRQCKDAQKDEEADTTTTTTSTKPKKRIKSKLVKVPTLDNLKLQNKRKKSKNDQYKDLTFLCVWRRRSGEVIFSLDARASGNRKYPQGIIIVF